MKTYIFIALCFISRSVFSQILFSENFETRDGYIGGSTLPPGWTTEYESGYEDWGFQEGGHLSNPDSAAEGVFNAIFQVESYENERTKLITSPIDLSVSNAPRLSFWLVQDDWYWSGFFNNDELRVYYKTSYSGNWKLLKSYTSKIDNWTEQEIYLPTSDLSKTYYLAFEGKTGYGHGVCIDNIAVEETGSVEKQITNLTIEQASEEFVASNTDNNPILQIPIRIQGNSGTLQLNSFSVSSKNTDDSDIKPNGVKLWITELPVFANPMQLGTGQNFSNGSVTISSINQEMPYGYSYLWLTYDIAASAPHGHTFDASILSGSIVFSNANFPAETTSPDGSRTIFQTLYYQDFDSDFSDWNISAGFEVGTPSGYGGSEGGNSDPNYAISFPNVLGNNVIATNDEEALYANDLPDTSVFAISPIFDLSYYVNSKIRFDQWLNVDGWDNVSILYSLDGNKTWQTLWTNAGAYIQDKTWQSIQKDVASIADRESSVSFRFSLGPTNNNLRYSGWNIDNFVVVANFIDVDLGVTNWFGPFSGCSLGTDKKVRVQVNNFAGKPADFPIPIGYSLDGGTTWIMDTIKQTIGISDSLVFEFSEPANLSNPGIYNPLVKIFAEADEYPQNDQFEAGELFSIPEYSLPYESGFENGPEFWSAEGKNNTWEVGYPAGSKISSPYSGTKCWITSAFGMFQNNDSTTVTSPCFNFKANEDPVIEFALAETFDQDIAGASIQYSTDTGKTWMTVPQSGSGWFWYTDTNVPVLKDKFNADLGWATPTNGWKVAKQYLPKNFKDETVIQFRIVFASKETGLTSEGIAFDDFKLYNAPPDVGVISIDSPVESCELSANEAVTVTIKNFGIDTLKTGDQMYVSYDVDGKKQCTDTFAMGADVLPGETFAHIFSETADMSHAGTYSVVAYTCHPLDTDFYNDAANNDTAKQDIWVKGMPDYTLGPDFGSEIPTSVVLDAGEGFDSYSWSTGSSDRYLTLPAPGAFHVTVTNAQGCSATDSIRVVYSAEDIEITAINSPVSACVISEPQNISISVKNNHNHTFIAGDKLVFAYTINNEIPILDTLTLSASFATSDVISFTFAEKANLTDTGTYLLKAYSILPTDINLLNDTISATIGHYGIPDIEFGTDTIFTLEPDSITLSVDGTYLSYLWQDNATSATYQIESANSQMYAVTVTADHGCGTDKDSVFISTTDIALTSIENPVTNCSLEPSETVIVNVANTGYNVLTSGTVITVLMSADEGAWTSENVVLTNDLYPASNTFLSLTQSVDFSSVGEHLLKIMISTKGDVDFNNNALTSNISVFGYPSIDLGADTLYAHRDSLPILNAKINSQTALYSWNDILSSTEAVLQVINSQNWNYVVTVSDNGCDVQDSVMIFTDDFSIDNTNPNISFCELGSSETLQTTIKNSSDNVYEAGTALTVSYEVNGGAKISESLILENKLAQNQTAEYIFNQKADLSVDGSYTIKYTVEYPTDVYSANNSLTGSAEAIGYPDPNFGFGDTISTQQPDTVELWLDQEYDSYVWHDGGNHKDVFYIKDPAPQWYKVTVGVSPGCYGSDSVFIDSYDIGITAILNPTNNCTSKGNTNVTLRLLNNFDAPIPAGDTIFLAYQFSGNTVTDTLTLAQDWLWNESTEYTFKEALPIDSANSYKLVCNVDYYRDAVSKNNKDSIQFEIYGYTDIDLGPDTIFTQQPDTVLLNAGNDFAFANWNTGNTGLSFFAPYDYSFTYTVEAADFNICYSYDTVTIITTDISVEALLTPLDSCVLSSKNKVLFVLMNQSTDTIKQGTSIPVTVVNRDSVFFIEALTLDAPLYPLKKDTLSCSNALDLSNYESTELALFISYATDVNATNDTIKKTISAFGNPDVQLDSDTLYIGGSNSALVSCNGVFQAYSWSTGENIASITLTDANIGWTYITATDDNGCSGTDSVLVMSQDISIRIANDFSNCSFNANEQISINIKNEGAGTVTEEDSIVVTLIGNTEILCDTTLSVTIAPKDSVIYTFGQKFDFSDQKNITIIATIAMKNDVIQENNQDSQTMNAYGYPAPTFALDTLFTLQPDTVILSLPETYYGYQWNTSSTEPSLSISENRSAWYRVTVENQHGCKGSDSIFIFSKDISLQKFITPITACKWATQEAVTLRLQNSGVDTLTAGSEFPINLTINGSEYSTDTLTLSTNIAPLETIEYTFLKKIDAQNYSVLELEAILIVKNDVVHENNSISAKVQENLYPPIAFRQQFISTTRTDTLQFSFPEQYSYMWSTGETSPSIQAKDTAKARYIVTAKDSIGCTTIDTVTVLSMDAKIDSLVAVKSACSLTEREVPIINIVNNSNRDIYQIDSLLITSKIDNESYSQLLKSSLAHNSDSTVKIGRTFDFEAIGEHTATFMLATNVFGKTIVFDSLKTTISHYGYPQADIKEDTIRNVLPATVTLPELYLYQWSNNSNSNTIKALQSGWEFVTISNDYGCSTTDSVFIIGYDISIDSIIFPLGDEICQADVKSVPQIQIRNNGLDTLDSSSIVTLTLNSIADTIVFAEDWKPNQAILYKPKSNLSSSPGVYTISATLSMKNDISLSNNNKSLEYEVLSTPYFSFMNGYDTIQAGAPPFSLYKPDELTGNYTYQWSTGTSEQNISVTQTGWYGLTVTNSNSCYAKDSIYIILDKEVSSSQEKAISIKIYPTIFNDFLAVETHSRMPLQIQLINEAGVAVLKESINAKQNNIAIETEHIANGIYTCIISCGEIIKTVKLIKQ